MKKRKNDKTNLFIPIISILLVMIIFTLSISWATFSQNLLMDQINLTVRAQADIRITNFSLSNDEIFNTNQGVSNWEKFNVKNISASITLPNDSSQIRYKVQITNFGNIDMGILNITGLQDNLEYIIEDYELGKKICDNSSKCNLGMEKEFYLIIKYKNGKKIDNNNDYLVNLEFDFEPVYKITYEYITGNYQNEILNNDTLKIDFGNNAPYDIEVKINNLIINNYTYENNVLTIPNISGNTVIRDSTTPTIVVNEGKYHLDHKELVYTATFGKAGGNVSCINTSDNSKAVTSYMSISALGPNQINCTAIGNNNTSATDTGTIIMESNNITATSTPFHLYATGNASVSGSSVIVSNGGIQYGPYISMQKGCYVVTYWGNNLNKYPAGYNATLNNGQEHLSLINLNYLSSDSNYRVYIPSYSNNFEVTINNAKNDVITVDKLLIGYLGETCP